MPEEDITSITIRKEYASPTLDETLTHLCLDMTIGEVVHAREHATNARHALAANMVFDAVFKKDIGIIDQIIKRIDGTVPEEGKRDGYANYMGDALDDVLDMRVDSRINVNSDDPAIIALAKATLYIAMQEDKGNYQIKKEKHTALDMIFSRTGGRKVSPAKPMLSTVYTDPDWMGVLPSGTDE